MTTDQSVAVIIPARNAAGFIRATLESVASQTWRDLHVVVVDDNSTDETAAIAATFDGVRILHGPGRSAAAARNTGLRATLSRYVQFLDADDILSPSKIELQVKALQSAGEDSIASCGWAHFTASPADALPETQPVWRVADPVDWLVQSLLGGGMMQTAGWLVPRNIIDKAGEWNTNLTLHDDGDFFARVLTHASRNIFVDGATVYYREVPGSLSRRRDRQSIESSLEVCRSRERAILSRRHDAEAMRAIATQYAQFVYEFGSVAPDLADIAMDQLRDTGAEPAHVIGGSGFRALAGAVGFPRAAKLRGILKK